MNLHRRKKLYLEFKGMINIKISIDDVENNIQNISQKVKQEGKEMENQS